MTAYRDPSFQDRRASAADAKSKALEQLRAKPPVDPAIESARHAAALKRETAKAAKSSARKAAESAAAQATADAAAAPPPPTEAERKAARDARYAARKNRR